MKKEQKHLIFPKELLDKIEGSDKVPKYMDFTSKVFLLLEQALKESEKVIGKIERREVRKRKSA